MGPITGTVFYLKRSSLYENTKPYFCYIPPDQLNGAPLTNQEYEPFDVPISDIREEQDEFTLDKNGFEIGVHPLNEKYTFEGLQENTALLSEYKRDVEIFLKEKLKAQKVVIFDDELRKRNPEFPKSLGQRSALEQPVRGVHVDSSPGSAVERAVYTCQSPAERARLSGRIQIINTWRPLFTPLDDWPLGVCDGGSVNVEDDLIPSDSVFPDTVSETLQVFHNSEHRWYFLGKQKRDEILMFKIFDSGESVARFCPHASFELNGGTARPRESIETRAVVFYGEAAEG